MSGLCYSSDTSAAACAEISCLAFTTYQILSGSTVYANVSVVVSPDLPVPNIFHNRSPAVPFKIYFTLELLHLHLRLIHLLKRHSWVISSFTTLSSNLSLQTTHLSTVAIAWPLSYFNFCSEATSAFTTCTEELDGAWTLHSWIKNLSSCASNCCNVFFSFRD